MKNRLYIGSNILGLSTIGLALTMIAFIFGISCQTSVPPTPTPGLPEAPATGIPPAMPLVVEVAIEDFSFTPDIFTVPVGTTVTWYNNDSVPHTITTRDPLFDSGRLSKDETFSFAFNQISTFEYYCTIHPYITGKIIVE